MGNLIDILARVEVDDIDAALPLYQRISGTTAVRRFAFGEVSLAWVGRFLLLSGPAEVLAKAHRTATLLVRDVDEAVSAVTDAGGEILDGPADAPNGPRMIARHADGAVFEYIQP